MLIIFLTLTLLASTSGKPYIQLKMEHMPTFEFMVKFVNNVKPQDIHVTPTSDGVKILKLQNTDVATALVFYIITNDGNESIFTHKIHNGSDYGLAQNITFTNHVMKISTKTACDANYSGDECNILDGTESLRIVISVVFAITSFCCITAPLTGCLLNAIAKNRVRHGTQVVRQENLTLNENNLEIVQPKETSEEGHVALVIESDGEMVTAV